MSIEYIILLLMVCGIVYVDNKIYGMFLTPTIVLSVPFLVTISVLILIGPQYGFPIISGDNILVLCLGIFCFWIGSLLMVLVRDNKNSYLKYTEVCFSPCVYKRILRYVVFVEIVTFLRYLIVFNTMGLSRYIALDGGNGIMVNGIGAHLMFSIYPFIPVILSEGVKQKKNSYMLIVITAITEMFFTFTKYHVLFLTIACFIYLLNRNSKLLLPVSMIIILGSTLLFSMNYIINFMANEWIMKEDFLANHFLKYMLGAIVYSSIAPNIMLEITDTATIVMSQFTAFPNMFLSRIFSAEIFPVPSIPFINITKYGERGNVMNWISHMYSTHNYLVGSIYFLFMGFIVTKWIYKSKNILIKVYLLTILLLSFFSSYFQLIIPWEILIYCLILPNLFRIKVKKSICN